MGAQRGPYGLNNDSQPVEHISKATPTGQKKATKTIRTNIQEGQPAPTGPYCSATCRTIEEAWCAASAHIGPINCFN